METLIVVIIIVAALAYLIKKWVINANRSGSCSCGGCCSHCPPSEDCAEKKAEKVEGGE